jgi:hypothetical protein
MSGVCTQCGTDSGLCAVRHPDAPNPMCLRCAKVWQPPKVPTVAEYESIIGFLEAENERLHERIEELKNQL